MNRRKPIQKDYFAILPAFSGRWFVWSGLFIIIAIAVIWVFLSSADTTSAAMASEDIAALLIIIIIPLAIIFAALSAFEKITGFTIISGVEWVGEKTLNMIDWCIRNVKQSLGLEIKKTNHRVASRPKPRPKPIQKSHQQADVRTALLDADTKIHPDKTAEPGFSDFQVSEIEHSEAVFDFSSEPAIEDIDNVIAASSDTLAQSDSAVIAPESLVPVAEENQSLATSDNTLQPAAGLDNSFNEFETELKTFFPENEDGTANKNDYDSVEIAGVANEQSISQELNRASLQNEPDDMIQALHISKQKIVNSIDHGQQIKEEENNADPDTGIQEQKDNIQAGIFNADSLANDPDFISRALQAANKESNHLIDNNQADAQIIPDPDLDSSAAIVNTEAASLPNEPDFMIKALQAAKDKDAASIGVENEAESTSTQPSLLEQAEQTAANIISSFSQRFSKSFSVQQKPDYQLPSIELLDQHQKSVHAYTVEELDTMSRSVERVLNDYKVSVEVVGAYPGPVITRFELSLAPGIKVSRVSGLAKDLARAMLVTSVRVVEIIEGTPYIGLEIPNQERELVSFREIIASDQFQQAKSPITLALGKDVSGQTVVADLAKMPHLLVAGTTGSGKSVAINTMILSMLYKATPDQVRMIMVDPKMLELSIYEGIPHLLTPVVTDMKEAQNALRWAVAEMERRYKLMSKVGVRNLAGFNQKITDAEARGESIRDPLFQLIEPLAEGESFPVLTTLPSIVIVIDELADMMMIVGKKVEELIARLAQKARAAGIHLILATQRPSVDVLTGLIKANVPTRISFQVSSRIDSRTILDQGGAEALLGNGDMLFLPSGTSVPTRSHGAFVDDHEVHAVVDYLKSLGTANYLSEITREEASENSAIAESAQDEVDALYNDAVSFVLETGRASISSIQRRFKVGYNRAARMIDQMEDENIVSEPEGNGSRRVLDRE